MATKVKIKLSLKIKQKEKIKKIKPKIIQSKTALTSYFFEKKYNHNCKIITKEKNKKIKI